MEVILNNSPIVKPSAFIEANTEEMTLHEIKRRHIIPVFTKDNEPLISQVEFIELVGGVAKDIFGEVSPPQIRVSHPVKGRIPSARHKKASELMPHEKTLYYERCAFLFEVLHVRNKVAGQSLNLVVGGIKAYNLDNMNKKGGSLQVFKFFIGFKVKVCCNLCISTDGYVGDVKFSTIAGLKEAILSLIEGFAPDKAAASLSLLTDQTINENQMAYLLGRCRMYVAQQRKTHLPEFAFSDSQVKQVAVDYYQDENFGVDDQGNISLWSLYNLFTHASKSTYIDKYGERNVNALGFIQMLSSALCNNKECWFLQ